jgi:3-mercaptopyruvate sulfurtransferase SseA
MKDGYKNVHALLGGLYGYKDAGGEVTQAPAPPPAQATSPSAAAAPAPEAKATDAAKPKKQ